MKTSSQPPDSTPLDTADASARRALRDVRRVVLKIGSSVLVGDGRSAIDRRVFCSLVASVADAVDERGIELVLVSSGAVALGRRTLSRRGTPERTGGGLTERQALAAIGQPALMNEYALELGHYGLRVAQLLMTRADFHDRQRFLNARQTLRSLIELGGVVPVLNENDTLSSEELRFGDNDQLAALTTTLFEADLLILLSDVDALHDADPRANPNAQRLGVVRAEDPGLEDLCSPPDPRGVGTGGMRSKVLAARAAAAYGVPTVIAGGRDEGAVRRILAGHDTGTLLMPESPGLNARKAWLRFSRQSAGRVFVDAGAVAALRERGKSLLSRGVTAVEGAFIAGDAIDIVAPDGEVVARGLAGYAADDLQRIVGLQGERIEEVLGFTRGPAIVHRDDMVLV